MRTLLALLLSTLILACEHPAQTETQDLLQIPEYFPPIDFPADNQFTEARWKLGKKLFFEKKFSINEKLSCASCHQPQFAFANHKTVGEGVYERKGIRNVPSLGNIAYHPYYLREGGIPSIEMQVLVPVQEHEEFDHNIVKVAEQLAKDSLYQKMSREAYNKPMQPFVLSRALACFQRSIITGNSRYDQYKYQGKEAALNPKEKRGLELFFSAKTNCSQCHGGFNFTNYKFLNNGLDTIYTDPGRYRLTKKSEDKHRFKVPSLRNAAITAPYMHNGSLSTLEAVIEHYNQGGKNHPQKSDLIRPLNLSAEEQQALLAFLHTLTDSSFIKDPRWSSPF